MPLIVAQSNQDVSDVSPDGRWIAYESIESGEDTIFVRPFPDVESGRWQVSSGNSNTPIWSPAGDELFFLALQGLRIMSVQIETNPSFSASPAQIILEGDFLIQRRQQQAYLRCLGRRRAFPVDQARRQRGRCAGSAADHRGPELVRGN